MTKQHMITTLEREYQVQRSLYNMTGAKLYSDRCTKLRNQLILLYDTTTAAGEVEHLNEMVG